MPLKDPQSFKEIELLFEDYKIILRASDNDMTLYCSATPLPGRVISNIVTQQRLESFLSDYIALSLIDPNQLKALVIAIEKNTQFEEQEIARGIEPKIGQAGAFVFLVKPYRKERPGEALEVIDHHFVRRFDNVELGTIVGRIYPPKVGANGLSVFGNKLAGLPGRTYVPNFNQTLTVYEARNGEAYKEVKANIAGYLTEENGALTVKDSYLIDADVDLKTGDIDFVGNVYITGEVKKGFHVNAYGDVNVDGDVRGSICSETGSILVKGMVYAEKVQIVTSQFITAGAISQVLGQKHTQIKAGKSFSAYMIDGINAECLGDINIQKDARNCQLRAMGRVIVGGALIGGKTYAALGVEASKLGTPKGSETNIVLCSDVEYSSAYSSLISNLESYEHAKEMSILYLGPLVEHPEKTLSLAPLYRENMEELLRKHQDILAAIKALELRKNEILSKAKHNTEFKVKFHDKLFPGVVIGKDKIRYAPDIELSGPLSLELNVVTGKFLNKAF